MTAESENAIVGRKPLWFQGFTVQSGARQLTLVTTQVTIRITAESKIQRIHIDTCPTIVHVLAHVLVSTCMHGDDSQMLKKVVHVKALDENAHWG